jgi:UPF0755 protein
VRWLVRLFLILVVIGGLACWWFFHELGTPFYGPASAEVFVNIPRGMRGQSIAQLLEEKGVLRSRYPFLLHLNQAGAERSLQAGEYRFASPATPRQIADRLIQGDVFARPVTIPEGLTARETIALIARDGWAEIRDLEPALKHTEWISDLDPEARNLEGYLFPETYNFPRTATGTQIVKATVERFREVFNRLKQSNPIREGWSIRDIVTAASIVEKEVGNSEERGLVASVIMNRLEKRIPLACDPTIVYALKLTGKYDGNIRKADLAMGSPYNTYRYPGLPPGPIANPGAESLKAVLAPPKTDYLYFVSRNNGTHEFSTNLEDHSRAVFRYQKSPH